MESYIWFGLIYFYLLVTLQSCLTVAALQLEYSKQAGYEIGLKASIVSLVFFPQWETGRCPLMFYYLQNVLLIKLSTRETVKIEISKKLKQDEFGVFFLSVFDIVCWQLKFQNFTQTWLPRISVNDGIKNLLRFFKACGSSKDV